MSTPKILVVDDEPQNRKLLWVGLASYGYEVMAVSNGEEAFASVAHQTPDIAVVATHLGSSPDGFEVCQVLRQRNRVSIMMLAVGSDKKTNLAALNAGADDCLAKPVDMEELEARIRAVLRRRVVGSARKLNSEIRARDLVIDVVKRRVTLKGEEIHLTPIEYNLLCALATHPGVVLLCRTLLEQITGKSDNLNPEHHLGVFINTLRKKLQDDTANRAQPHYIYNEPGLGYRFAEVQPEEAPIPV